MTRTPIFRLIASLVLCFAVAGLGSVATAPNSPGWDASLVKPSFKKPHILFPIVWNILYAMMAFALWQLWQSMPSKGRNLAISLFLVQLTFNLAWSWVFFWGRSIGGGLVVIGMLDLLLGATIVVAAKVNRIAALLLVPYLRWIIYATALNGSIWHLNI